MFPDSDKDSLMLIGEKNIAAAEEHLGNLGIPIVAKDVEGAFRANSGAGLPG